MLYVGREYNEITRTKKKGGEEGRGTKKPSEGINTGLGERNAVGYQALARGANGYRAEMISRCNNCTKIMDEFCMII